MLEKNAHSSFIRNGVMPPPAKEKSFLSRKVSNEGGFTHA